MNTLDLPLYARGKVRDIYDLGDRLLIVATDRISAFDVVLPTGIPDKGLVLTQLSAFWFEKTGDIVPNHFLRIVDDTHVEGVDTELPRDLIGRAMLVNKARRLDVECIVRGYAVLGSAGYNGPVCIEAEDRAYEGSLESRKDALRQSARYLRQFMP